MQRKIMDSPLYSFCREENETTWYLFRQCKVTIHNWKSLQIWLKPSINLPDPTPESTLYNVCSVHQGMFSTSGGYHEYIGGISWVHRGMFSTSGEYHDECGGIPWVHREMFSTLEAYHEYIGGISWIHRGMFSTSEEYHDTCGGATS